MIHVSETFPLSTVDESSYVPHSSQYGSGHMQQNLSFSEHYLGSPSYSNDGRTGYRKSPVGYSSDMSGYTGLGGSPRGRVNNASEYYEG